MDNSSVVAKNCRFMQKYENSQNNLSESHYSLAKEEEAQNKKEEVRYSIELEPEPQKNTVKQWKVKEKNSKGEEVTIKKNEVDSENRDSISNDLEECTIAIVNNSESSESDLKSEIISKACSTTSSGQIS